MKRWPIMKNPGGVSSQAVPSEMFAHDPAIVSCARRRRAGLDSMGAAWKCLKTPVAAQRQPSKVSFAMTPQPNGKSPLDGSGGG